MQFIVIDEFGAVIMKSPLISNQLIADLIGMAHQLPIIANISLLYNIYLNNEQCLMLIKEVQDIKNTCKAQDIAYLDRILSIIEEFAQIVSRDLLFLKIVPL